MADHSRHGRVMVHEPPADWQEAYTRAFEASEPDTGHAVVSVTLEAAE
jgi:hypothetical protein